MFDPSGTSRPKQQYDRNRDKDGTVVWKLTYNFTASLGSGFLGPFRADQPERARCTATTTLGHAAPSPARSRVDDKCDGRIKNESGGCIVSASG